MASLDLSKAFDSITHREMYESLLEQGCHQTWLGPCCRYMSKLNSPLFTRAIVTLSTWVEDSDRDAVLRL